MDDRRSVLAVLLVNYHVTFQAVLAVTMVPLHFWICRLGERHDGAWVLVVHQNQITRINAADFPFDFVDH